MILERSIDMPSRYCKNALRFLLILLAALMGQLVPAHADAADATSLNTAFEVYTADINGDGWPDILAKAVPKIVVIPLDDDFILPMAIPPRLSSFALISAPGGSYSIQNNPDASVLGYGGWTPGGYQVTYREGSGATPAALLITSSQPDMPGFNVAVYQDRTLALNVDPGVTFFHNDASGTPMLSTDAAGDILWKENYLPYGDKLNKQPASIGNSIGFHGKPYDNSAGLSYMGARYYDPMLGRFMGVDPKEGDPENIHSFNRYAYANNNPYRYVDPDGHSPIDVAFLVFDIGKLGVAVYTGVGAGAALADVALSVVGVASPIPGTGQALKAMRALEHGAEAVRGAKEVLAVNVAVGKTGEAITRAHLGEKIAGEQITFITSTGARARPDFLTRIEGKLGIVESKTGQAKLSKGQAQLRDDIVNGRAVTPVGKNAEAAGLTAGEKLRLDSFTEARIR